MKRTMKRAETRTPQCSKGGGIWSNKASYPNKRGREPVSAAPNRRRDTRPGATMNISWLHGRMKEIGIAQNGCRIRIQRPQKPLCLKECQNPPPNREEKKKLAAPLSRQT